MGGLPRPLWWLGGVDAARYRPLDAGYVDDDSSDEARCSFAKESSALSTAGRYLSPCPSSSVAIDAGTRAREHCLVGCMELTPLDTGYVDNDSSSEAGCSSHTSAMGIA